eukprot:CAMPEP_0202442058 /NCGR_PEP_ID=MMETSP1360-20130828/1543_1 /ASSEMBLY_ACC=CAM_ASM_000848 /TAXON_ID=515479 /ORGANISM="Licmophora paradoxa, Strain CCMP2313" /LENGTH=872 /DNA_ID=CAMNT_0049057301 /DNA_START=30 /DNA_END=2648 /DNA_ORIENTATION=-
MAVAQALEEQDKSSRRSARRGKNAEGGVFYGSQSQMSQKKLMETIIRLCAETSSHSLLSLMALIGEESASVVQRLRTSIGRLIWKRNQLSRCQVSSLWTDQPLWDMLQKEPIYRLAKEEEQESHSDLDEVQMKECIRLVKYIQGLHQTELQLRAMILKCINDRSLMVTACAADEKIGTLESFDSNDFDDPTSIEWSKSGHEYIGKEVFRPAVQPSDGITQCRWFEVSEFVESVEAEDVLDKNERSDLKLSNPPLKAERRMRFRAQPITEDGYEDYGKYITLTEAQVAAGLEAAKLRRKAVSSNETTRHPFTGSLGTKVKMRDETEEFQCFVVGYDTILKNGAKMQMVMLLHDSSAKEAFWVTLSTDEDGCLQCYLMKDGNKVTYQIEQADYDAESDAYKMCKSVVDYLERIKDSSLFMEPVDPVALNIPSYFDIVKRPMDISTLALNLEKGVYSKIPPKSAGRTPAARMLNGPFKEDAMRIFDNAILFNPPDDFVHDAAQNSKRLLLKKIEQLTSEGNATSTKTERLTSIYVDEDSDVDMYEYESEIEDEDYSSGKRKAVKRKRKKKTKDEFSTKMMEGPLRLHSALSESNGLRSPLSDLPVLLNPSSFSVPHGKWSCRLIGVDKEDAKSDPTNKRTYEELADIVELQRQALQEESNNLRRSNRSNDLEDGANRKSGKKVRKNGEKLGIEYFPTHMCYDENIPITNRVELESFFEHQHESVYAKLYQKYSKKLSSKFSLGVYEKNSFPPYLGRLVPTGGPTASDSTWEIREDYVVAAVRWVLRGLIGSGHLAALEPLSLDAPLSSGVIMANDIYYFNPTLKPFDQLELRRKKKDAEGGGDSSEEEIELSEYEKLRKDRVARNQERLKMLGLA